MLDTRFATVEAPTTNVNTNEYSQGGRLLAELRLSNGNNVLNKYLGTNTILI